MNHLSLINRYFNYGYTGRTGKIIATIAPGFTRNQSASLICESVMRQASNKVNNPHATHVSLTIPKLESRNPVLNEISEYIKTHLEPYLVAALVHGSVATGEIIHYSDFDGLIVIRNEVFENKKLVAEVSYHLNRAFAMMLKFDPVQHHGWMIATENDLTNWPAAFFPPALFQYSKSLLSNECQLTIRYSESKNKLKADFLKFAESLKQTLKNTEIPDNAYQLKSILSEFMLLPALYVAARDGKGVFKKFSFDLAANDFSSDEWNIMNEVSDIRLKWPSMSFVTGLDNLKCFTPLTKKLQIKNSRFQGNNSPVSNLNLYQDMSALIDKMILKLK